MIKRKAGRPKGTFKGRQERIIIGISKTHKEWLKTRKISYAKTVARLINKETGETDDKN